jgi:hypothetical protein
VALAAFSIFSSACSIGYNAPTLEPHVKQVISVPCMYVQKTRVPTDFYRFHIRKPRLILIPVLYLFFRLF